jgi:trimethylamine--corrinoid protein Co-methyltransferase
LDEIHRIGTDGDFISSKHTRKHFREDWYPQLFERRNYDGWKKAGGKTLRQRAQEKALAILAEHKPEPLPPDVQNALHEIVAQADASWKASH